MKNHAVYDNDDNDDVNDSGITDRGWNICLQRNFGSSLVPKTKMNTR